MMDLVEAFFSSWRVQHPDHPPPDLSPLTLLLQSPSTSPNASRDEIQRRLENCDTRIAKMQGEITRECMIRDLLQQLAERGKELETKGGSNSSEQKAKAPGKSEKPGFFGRRKAKHSPSPTRGDNSSDEKEMPPAGKTKNRGKKPGKRELPPIPGPKPVAKDDAAFLEAQKATSGGVNEELSGSGTGGMNSQDASSLSSSSSQSPDVTSRKEDHGSLPPQPESPKAKKDMRELQTELAAVLHLQRMARPLPPRPDQSRPPRDIQDDRPDPRVPLQPEASPPLPKRPGRGEGAGGEKEPSPTSTLNNTGSQGGPSASSSRSNSPKVPGERSDSPRAVGERSNSPRIAGDRSEIQAKLAAIVQNNLKRSKDGLSPRSESPSRERLVQPGSGDGGCPDQENREQSLPKSPSPDREVCNEKPGAKDIAVDDRGNQDEQPQDRMSPVTLRTREQNCNKPSGETQELERGVKKDFPTVYPPHPSVFLSSLRNEINIQTDRHGRLPDFVPNLPKDSGRAPSPSRPPTRQTGAPNQRPYYEEIFAWPLAPDSGKPSVDPCQAGSEFPTFFPAPTPVPAPKSRRSDFHEEFCFPPAVGSTYHKHTDVTEGVPRGTGVPRANSTRADNSSRFREPAPHEESSAQSVGPHQPKQADAKFRRSISASDARVYGDVVVVPCSAPVTFNSNPPSTATCSVSSARPRGVPTDYVQMSVPANLPVFPAPPRSDAVQSQTVPRPRKPPKPVPAPRKRPPVSPRKDRDGRNSAEIAPGAGREEENTTSPAALSATRPAVNNAHAFAESNTAGFGRPRDWPGAGPAVSADSSPHGVQWGDKSSGVTSACSSNNAAALDRGDRRADRMAERGIQLAVGNAAALAVSVAASGSGQRSSPSKEREDRESQDSEVDYSECLSHKATPTKPAPETSPSSGAESRLANSGGKRGGENPTGCGDSATREGDPSSRPTPQAFPTTSGNSPPPPGQAGKQGREPSHSQPAARLDIGQGGGHRLVTFHPLPQAAGHGAASTRPGGLHPNTHPQSQAQTQPHPASANKTEVRGAPDLSRRGGVQPDTEMKKFTGRKAERKDLEADGYGAATLHGTYRRIPDSASTATTPGDGSMPRPPSPAVDYENTDLAASRLSGEDLDTDPYSMLSRVDQSLEDSPEVERRNHSDGEVLDPDDVVLRKKSPNATNPKVSDQEPVYAKVKKKKPRVVSYENWTINALVSRPMDSTESSEGEDDPYDNVRFSPSPSPASLKKFPDKGSSDSGLSEDIAGGETSPSDRDPPTPADPPSLPTNLQELRNLQTDDDDAAGDDERDERSDSNDSDKNEDNVSLTSDIIYIPGSDVGNQEEGEEPPPTPCLPRHQDQTSSSEEEAETTSNKSYDELDAGPQTGPEDEDEVKLQMRLLIVKGVLDSEKSYLSMLLLLMTYKRSLEASSQTSQPVISSDDIKSIFGNLPALFTIHQNFVEGLEKFVQKGDAHAEIGDIFKTLVVHMPRFGDYMENYQQAVATIQRCCQENVQFQEIARKVTFSSAGKEITNLEDALFKPVQRVQRNTLVLHDLLKHTPEKHKDFYALKRALQLAQHNLESFGSSIQTTQQEDRKHLVKSSFFVELVSGARKLRCVFLFNDVIVCTKREVHRNKVTFDCKWFIPLAQLEHDTRFSYQDDQKHLHREEIQELKRKIGQLKNELKTELKKEEDTKDKHWSLSGLAAARSVEKRKKKIQELEGQMILASPRLPFKLGMEGGKTYTLLMTTDYEREEWRETITALCRKGFSSDHRAMNAIYVQELVNSVKELPQVNKIGSVIMQKDEETLDGTLNVTVHKLNGLTESTAAATYCCLEMDSYGHFFMKARTNICPATADPAWNEDFELELDGSQTLRILAYQKRPDGDGDILLGRGAVELSKSWLTSNFQEKTISLNEVSLVISVRHTPADKTMRRTPSQTKSAVFGVRIGVCTRREGKTVPTIVTTCLSEVEKRGLEEVGIYRVSGVSSEVQRLKKMFDKNARTAANVLGDTDINAVTGVLKLYFRELPEPLFTEANYSKFVDAFHVSDQDAKERCMLDLLHSLPDANYYCIVTLAEHLIKVSQKDSVNKMSLHNLSTIFGPTLLAPASKGSTCITADLISKGAEDVMIQAGIIHCILTIQASGRSLRRSAPC